MNEVRSSPLKNWLSTPLLNVLTPSSISGNFSLTSFPQIASNFLARCPFHAADKTRLSKILKGPTNLKALSACVSQRNHCTKGPKKRPGVSTSRPGRTQKRSNRPGQRTLGGPRVPLVLIVVPKCPPEFPRLSCMCVCVGGKGSGSPTQEGDGCASAVHISVDTGCSQQGSNQGLHPFLGPSPPQHFRRPLS